MKRIIFLALTLAFVLSFSAFAQSPVTITIGASVAPHAEILEVAKALLAEQGIDLEIVEYNDYILPNTAVDSGELDANFFQHVPYLLDFNEQNGTKLVSVALIHYEPFAIYAGKSDSLDALPKGGVIAIPNDGTNEARALLLLEANGLIKLNENIGLTATILDIAENPNNYVIMELEAAQIPRSLPDVDIGVINGNYALEARLVVADALAFEDAASEAAQTYANALVVREGSEEDEAILALIDALQSDEVRTFIEETYGGAVVPTF
jgi:D-methionine transport system substrate-binding protein